MSSRYENLRQEGLAGFFPNHSQNQHVMKHVADGEKRLYGVSKKEARAERNRLKRERLWSPLEDVQEPVVLQKLEDGALDSWLANKPLL